MIPAEVRIGDPSYPSHLLENCGYAARVNVSFPAIDGSISYFNGYETQPGLDYKFATARVGMNLLYETLHLELAGMYNFTTREYALNPKVAYDITDAFTVTASSRYLD